MSKYQLAETEFVNFHHKTYCVLDLTQEQFIVMKDVLRPIEIRLKSKFKEGVSRLLEGRNLIMKTLYDYYVYGMCYDHAHVLTDQDMINVRSKLFGDDMRVPMEQLWNVKGKRVKLKPDLKDLNESLDVLGFQAVDFDNPVFDLEFQELTVEF